MAKARLKVLVSLWILFLTLPVWLGGRGFLHVSDHHPRIVNPDLPLLRALRSLDEKHCSRAENYHTIPSFKTSLATPCSAPALRKKDHPRHLLYQCHIFHLHQSTPAGIAPPSPSVPYQHREGWARMQAHALSV